MEIINRLVELNNGSFHASKDDMEILKEAAYWYREAALGVMLVLLFVMRGSRLVMLYALCVQALLEGVVKYWYVCRWMQGSAVKLKTYCIWWSVPAAVIAGGCLLHLQHSALAMLLAAGGTFAFGLVCELRPGGCLHGYWEGLKKKFEKT